MRALLSLLLTAWTATVVHAAPQTVTVRSEATVTGRGIRLRDISDATGALGDIVLGAAALPGRTCTITPGEIRLRLRAARASVPMDRVSFPAAVRVTTVGGAVAGDALSTAAIEAVRKALPFPAEDVTIEPVSVPRLPALRGTPVVAAGAPVLRSAKTATVPLTLTAGGETRTVEVTLRIKVTAPGVVTARPIARHAVITAEDVTLAKVETGGAPILASVADVIGKRALRSLPSGRPLAAADAEYAPVLLANAPVTLRVTSGALEIRTAGITREDGRIGQIIRVRVANDPNRPGPGREIRARVVDSQTVVVEN